MIGKWISGGVQVTDTFGNYHHEYRVEFISESRLKFCDINPSESFCADFNYRLISGKTYLVENDRAKDGHWEISREGDRLLICIWENGNCVLFSRDTTSR
jgi:hypothetical protein